METHPSHRCRRPVPIAACLAVIASVGCTAPDPGPNEIAVRGTDYAFDVPDSLPPGLTSFGFENAGQVPHEMILVRLKEGVTLPQVLEAATTGADPREFMEGGAAILIAAPGTTASSRMLVDLMPGRAYALVCNFQDAEDQPPHIALGMASPIDVAAE